MLYLREVSKDQSENIRSGRLENCAGFAAGCFLTLSLVIRLEIVGNFLVKLHFVGICQSTEEKKKKKGCVVLKWGVWGKRKFLILWFRLSGCCTRISVAYKAECQTRLISVCLNHTCADKIWSLGCKGLFL